MIDTNIIMFIIMLLLSYVFGHKILPQLGIITLAVVSIYNLVVGVTVTQATVIPAFMFIINLIYATYMMAFDDKD